MLRGSPIDDPVVLTIVESIHGHLRRTVGAVVASIVAIAGYVVALVEVSGEGVSPWVPAAIVIAAGAAIAGHRWLITRSALVIAQPASDRAGRANLIRFAVASPRVHTRAASQEFHAYPT